MWLLTSAVRDALEQAYATGLAPTAEQQAAYEARLYDEDGRLVNRALTKAGDTATIEVTGVITKTPSYMAMMFGGGNVTYREITAALEEAEADPEIKSVDMYIDSPGGSVDGLFDALAAMQQFSKPIKAIGRNTVASAAYALASQADEIHAANRATRFGSVGIVVEALTSSNRVRIASTNAPKKAPDLSTDEGVAMVREELDAMHELFVEAIASGRGTDIGTVNAQYGQGGTLLADEAKKRGMIDSIAPTALAVVTSKPESSKTAATGKPSEFSTMDLNKLKADHPDVFAAAVDVGVQEERDRVSAHLTLGAASGDMDTAIKAVNEGTGMTATLQAQYMAAGLNKRDREDRAADEAAASGAANAAGSETPDSSDEVLALVEAQMGLAGE